MKGVCAALAMCLLSGLGFAQTWNSNAGGYNTGYGTVYGSFGLAQATQNMYTTMQMNMQRATMRQAMINKWGIEAVEKAEREAREGGGAADATEGPRIEVPPAPPARNLGVYQPDASVDTGQQLAAALGSTPEEQALIAEIFAQVKASYQQEAAARGWSNNIAGGLTFFTVTALTVYHDVDEPSEESVADFYGTMSQTIDSLPDLAGTSDHDKQAFDDMLVGFGGLLLAGYTEGKQTQDAGTLAMYRELAGQLIQMVLKVEPDRLRIEDGKIVVG